MEILRIERIQITKLFGDTNYDIQLPESNPIAIITAPNGRGKTTLLNLISLVFAPSDAVFNAIKSIPFDNFRCMLSNGKTVELKRTEASNSRKLSKTTSNAVVRDRLRALLESGDYVLSIFNSNKLVTSLSYSEAFATAIRMGPSSFLEDEDEVYYVPHRDSTTHLMKYVSDIQLDLLRKNECSVPVNYIRADRIQPPLVFLSTIRQYRELAETGQKSPLTRACENISRRIIDATKEYNKVVEQAKDELPEMFLEGRVHDLPLEDFMDGWDKYRSELTEFQRIGLITPTKDFTEGKNIESDYDANRKFLSTYLQAFIGTTEPLRDIYKKLNLFKSILDERNAITGKKAFFSRDGVKLTIGEREIDIDTLSSGEKHDFIMFYNLILDSPANGLVLIDEPEISLHIEWQETYLDKLMAICQMNGLRAIIATHSPNIVSNHYEFLVDKGET